MHAQLRAGRHDEVLAEAQAMVRAAPLRERRWSLLALAQYQSGAQGEALRTIHQLKAVLARQLGIDAGHEVVALEQAILRQDESLLSAPESAPSAANCPWQGLKPYGEGDADRFFGRDNDVESCLEILRRTSLLVLVGPSGCGKSSLLNAGVAATLRGRGRATVSISPGTHPMQAITVLGQARQDRILLVDQFEELFSLCPDVNERQEFLEALTVEAAARTVVVALRADHLADLASSPAFSRLVERGLYLVGGLAERDLRRAIEGPARQAGLVIEPGLVDVLVREVKDDPGALPLLSHALLETWKRREGNTLTVAGYRASGGIHDAVAQSAERLYARIEASQRHLLRDLVLRLVSPGSQGEPVRSRVPRRLVANDVEHDRLIDLLVGARLVTSDDGVLEITHEALARAWPRLRGWLDDDVEGQRMLHHLSSSADAWDSLGRPDSELYRGIRLARVLDWQQGRSQTALTDTEREFLEVARRADGGRGTHRRRAREDPGAPDPPAARRPGWGRRSPRRGSGRGTAGGRAGGQGSGQRRRRSRSTDQLGGSCRGRQGDRHRRHRHLDAAGGRRRPNGRLAGHPQQSARHPWQAPRAHRVDANGGRRGGSLRRQSGWADRRDV